MADITFSCPKCDGGIVVCDEGAGMTVNCPHCSALITIPEAILGTEPKPAVVGEESESSVGIDAAPPTEMVRQLGEIRMPSSQTVIGKHTIVNGRCSKCGCTEEAIRHFGWECGRRSSQDHSAKQMEMGSDDPIRCPKCRSSQLTANKRGFGIGKAAIGGILLGPVGLISGMIGGGQVNITCLKCGHVFLPGEGK